MLADIFMLSAFFLILLGAFIFVKKMQTDAFINQDK